MTKIILESIKWLKYLETQKLPKYLQNFHMIKILVETSKLAKITLESIIWPKYLEILKWPKYFSKCNQTLRNKLFFLKLFTSKNILQEQLHMTHNKKKKEKKETRKSLKWLFVLKNQINYYYFLI